MSYTVTVKQNHHNVAEGTEGTRVEDGQVGYRFEADNTDWASTVTFSWAYIQNHKEYFEVSRGQPADS